MKKTLLLFLTLIVFSCNKVDTLPISKPECVSALKFELTDPNGTKVKFTYDNDGKILSFGNENVSTYNYVYEVSKLKLVIKSKDGITNKESLREQFSANINNKFAMTSLARN